VIFDQTKKSKYKLWTKTQKKKKQAQNLDQTHIEQQQGTTMKLPSHDNQQ